MNTDTFYLLLSENLSNEALTGDTFNEYIIRLKIFVPLTFPRFHIFQNMKHE